MAAPLLALFSEGFPSRQMLFANDAPLGVYVSHADTARKAFTGNWETLNWVGSVQPSALPSITMALYFLAQDPILFAKWYAPAALLMLGLCAWLFFRQLGFHPVACVLGALAATLNTDPFSYACWGLPTLPLGMAVTFLALAAVVASGLRHRWLKLSLAGLLVGMSIMETYDSGALFSLYVAAFVMWQVLGEEGGAARKLARGIGRVAVVAVCAAFLAASALVTLTETQVKGIAGMGQEKGTRQRRWVEATQWSLPKLETLRLVIPGVFGYRLDTPGGGNYWGRVGRDPAWDDYLAQPSPDPANPPVGYIRHSGSGFYAGVVVVLVALWTSAQALRKQRSPLTDDERRFVRFWAVAALVSLLLAFGRHAPFYQLIYALPYFSTIRNPVKFLHPLNLSLIILCASGLNALWRGYVLTASPKLQAIPDQFKGWWKSGPAPDRRWTLGMIAAWFACLVGWLIYAGSRVELTRYLQKVGFGSGPLPDLIAAFSIREVGWFVLVLALSCGLLALILSGVLSGKRARWAGLAVGLVLVGDLVRANTPWIHYYDYREKYATNPMIEFLRQKAYEQRVIGLFLPWPNDQALKLQEPLQEIYQIEWAQHHFQYYRIQSTDIVQMARMGEDTKDFKTALGAAPGRLWELTNTRYLLTLAGAVEALNQQLDPAKKRFRLHTPFALQQERTGGPILTVTNATGPYALVEFTGALPRARLFSRWRVNTNDPTLPAASTEFSPGDLKDPLGLAAKLKEPAGAVSAHIHGRLSESTRAALAAWPGSAMPPAGLQESLVGDLNTIIKGASIWEESRFSQAGIRYETRELLRTNRAGSDLVRLNNLVRLNKLLLEDAYPSELSRNELAELANPAFDPSETVLVNNEIPPPVAATTNAVAGRVEFEHYEPKVVRLKADASASSVLLLNDHYHPDWRVYVDGKAAPLLRCNYLMRGVRLEPGPHTVEFRFEPSSNALYVSLAAIVIGIGLCGVLAFSRNAAQPEDTSSPARSPNRQSKTDPRQ